MLFFKAFKKQYVLSGVEVVVVVVVGSAVVTFSTLQTAFNPFFSTEPSEENSNHAFSLNIFRDKSFPQSFSTAYVEGNFPSINVNK